MAVPRSEKDRCLFLQVCYSTSVVLVDFVAYNLKITNSTRPLYKIPGDKICLDTSRYCITGITSHLPPVTGHVATLLTQVVTCSQRYPHSARFVNRSSRAQRTCEKKNFQSLITADHENNCGTYGIFLWD